MLRLHTTPAAALLTACLGTALVALGPAPAPAAAQTTTVSTSDIQRLQDAVYDIGSDINRLRGRDAARASDLQGRLDDLRDEVTYLRVKLRKEGSVSRSEYTDLRGRLEDLRNDARGGTTSGSQQGTMSGSTTPARTTPSIDTSRGSDRPRSSSGESAIPVGQELDVRLQDALGSDTSQVEDHFLATTLVDLQVDERVLIPAGSEMRGVVSSVTPAGRINRKGSMTVTFDQITVNGRTYPMRATVEQALESEGVRGEAGKIGAGAGVGAIIGGILGGLKGALAGILIGGGAVTAATDGTDVHLAPGTVLRVRLDSPPDIR